MNSWKQHSAVQHRKSEGFYHIAPCFALPYLQHFSFLPPHTLQTRMGCLSKNEEEEFVDFSTLKLKTSPNQFLMAPENTCLEAKVMKVSPTLPYSARELYVKIRDIASKDSSWRLSKEDESGMRLKFVVVTKVCKFKDDVDIVVISQDISESTICVYSRSRVGKSDLGANEKRVDRLIASLKGVSTK